MPQINSRRYRKQRDIVFRTKGHDCVYCGEWADQIDHIVPRKVGGDNSLDNLQPICKRCNLRKSARSEAVFLGSAATPPVFISNPSLQGQSVIHHSPFNHN